MGTQTEANEQFISNYCDELEKSLKDVQHFVKERLVRHRGTRKRDTMTATTLIKARRLRWEIGFGSTTQQFQKGLVESFTYSGPGLTRS
jgi:hypothetical protein